MTRVVVIEPGATATEWGAIAADKPPGGNRNSPPSVIAAAIGRAVTARKPTTRYAVGFGARPLIAARGLLPDRDFDARVTHMVELPR